MDPVEGVYVALDAIRSHKMRSFLTMLGIIVGVAAVITMISLGEGARRQVKQNMTSLGTNLLYVRAGSAQRGGVWFGAGTASKSLKVEDAQALLNECPTVQAVAPQIQSHAQAIYGNKNWYTNVVGSTPEYEFVSSLPLDQGIFFDDAAEKSRARVAVVGTTVIEQLFGDEDPVGKVIQVNRVACTIIGTVQKRGGTGWMDPDDVIVVPLATAQSRLFGEDDLSSITVKVWREDQVSQAVVEVEDVMRRRHRLTDQQENDFQIRNQADLMTVFSETTKTMTFLLAGIACVSLVVGGIGIMNIMLVSVAERTREIGTRIAVGARRADILGQFMLESVVISLAGGVIGIVIGLVGSRMLSVLANWNTAVSPVGIGLAFAFSVGVGVFFGIYPARRASGLDPISALHHE
jgi:putative ABC transport system permease protein